MPRPIHLTSRAQHDLDEAYEWWSLHRSAEQAKRWRDCCVAAIDSLVTRDVRWVLAAENANFPIEIRQLAFGLARRPTHRILFTIRPEMILVLRIRHLAQNNLGMEEI